MTDQYGSLDFWDNRYQNDTEPFEWYQNYSSLRHFLTPKYLCKPDDETTTKNPFHSIKECRVLIAGCGNSQMGEEMLNDGFSQGKITNIDFSSIVINQMKGKTDEWYENLHFRLRRERKLGEELHTSTHPPLKKKAEHPATEKMKYLCMDLTKKTTFTDESFDLILCKGTLDAVLCCTNSQAVRVQSMMNECHRVLDKKNGVMVIISYGEPENRLNCFDTSRWDVQNYSVPKPIVPGEKIGE